MRFLKYPSDEGSGYDEGSGNTADFISHFCKEDGVLTNPLAIFQAIL